MSNAVISAASKQWSDNPLVAPKSADDSHSQEAGGPTGDLPQQPQPQPQPQPHPHPQPQPQRTAAAAKRSVYGESLQQFRQARAILYHDIVDRKGFKRFSYDLYCQSFFWAFVTIFCIAEPVLCSIRKPGAGVGVNYGMQCLVLALSTAMLIFQICANIFMLENYEDSWRKRITSFEQKQQDKKQQGTQKPSWSYADSAIFQLHLPMVFEVTTTGALFLESVCIAGGWFFIYYRPGISSLRCFRVLRILYFHQLPRSTIYSIEGLWYCSPFKGVEFQLVEKACKFASQSLSNLTQEMFFLTHKTRGGFILMFLLFYTAFVVGMSVYHEVWDDITVVPDPNSRTGCNSVFLCTIIMLRLTFYDGAGMDFLTNLSDNHKFLFAVTVVYVCATAFGIFNGLIGVRLVCPFPRLSCLLCCLLAALRRSRFSSYLILSHIISSYLILSR